MRNKMLGIVGVIVVLFIALYFVNDYKNSKADDETANNETANNETANSENEDGDNLYDNQVNPDNLREEIDSGNPVTVYFYSPECPHCRRTTPVLVPLTREKDIDMKKMNLLKYEEQWDEYDIEGTPTVVYYEDREEVARISGEQSEDNFSVFFDEYVLNDN